jgi:Holliday junction resolvasome RuvABC endonuclease subunit
MERLNQTILGISPGTRSIGIGVIRDGELLDARVKTFPGKWSESKQKTILGAISKLINDFNVTAVFLKTIHESRSSAALNQLIYEIKNLLEKRKTKFCLYTIIDLKRHCLERRSGNRRTLMEQITEKYPELMFDRDKEIKSRNKYYTKMFEAIGCAML